MIDEKVLIERLEGESYLTTNDDGETDKFSVQVVEWKDIKKIIKDLASEHNNGWIPCSERLPEVKKEVLIFADDNAMFVGRLINGGFSVHDGDGWIDLKFILAWQPLPAPYKKGE